MITYLGIDGGGSRTRAMLVDESGRRLFYQEAGPTNPNLIDEETVRQTLSDLVNACIQSTATKPCAACFGLAGVGAPETARTLEDIIHTLGIESTILVPDAEVAFEAAFQGGPGILLIAGTGSICLGGDHRGSMVRTGGWGWLADDGGSASWIGLRALECSVRQHDGRALGCALKNAIFDPLGIDSEENIATRLYQPPLSRAQLAKLAPIVADLASQGDESAVKILQAAIMELAQLVRATQQKLSPKIRDVIAMGGLLENNRAFTDALAKELSGFSFKVAEVKPVEGAVAIAMKSAQSLSQPK